MSLLFFVNTYKIHNYSYIKGRSQCPLTSHETLQNNFLFIQTKEYIACTTFHMGASLLLVLCLYHTTTTFFYHNWASEPPDFLSELTQEWNISTTFSFLMQDGSSFRRMPTGNERLCYPSSKIKTFHFCFSNLIESNKCIT